MSRKPDLVPAIGAYARPYRIWTREHCAFEDFPQYRDGGPAMVTVGAYSVSYVTGSGIDGVELRIHTIDGAPGFRLVALYATELEARRVAFNLGAIAFMAYES